MNTRRLVKGDDNGVPADACRSDGHTSHPLLMQGFVSAATQKRFDILTVCLCVRVCVAGIGDVCSNADSIWPKEAA